MNDELITKLYDIKQDLIDYYNDLEEEYKTIKDKSSGRSLFISVELDNIKEKITTIDHEVEAIIKLSERNDHTQSTYLIDSIEKKYSNYEKHKQR